MSIDELRATATAYMDLAQDMSCEVDGRSINILDSYRTRSDPFAITVPSGSIWNVFGCSVSAGTYSPALGDGFYLMLAPLSAGPHAIHFRGTVGDPVNFTLDITYHLTVASGGNAVVNADISSASGDPVRTAAPATSRTSWGRLKSIYR